MLLALHVTSVNVVNKEMLTHIFKGGQTCLQVTSNTLTHCFQLTAVIEYSSFFKF